MLQKIYRLMPRPLIRLQYIRNKSCNTFLYGNGEWRIFFSRFLCVPPKEHGPQRRLDPEETANINRVVYCDPRCPTTAYDHEKKRRRERKARAKGRKHLKSTWIKKAAVFASRSVPMAGENFQTRAVLRLCLLPGKFITLAFPPGMKAAWSDKVVLFKNVCVHEKGFGEPFRRNVLAGFLKVSKRGKTKV